MSNLALEALYELRQQREIDSDRELLSANCQGSLPGFIKAAWPQLKPMEPYQDNWHIHALCSRLEAVTRGEIKRLQAWFPPGMMKPIDENALILMGDGSRKRLAEVQIGDYVITHAGRPRQVLDVHEQGLLDCLQITTDSRRVISTAADHPFLTPSGWRRADHLLLGEALGTLTKLDYVAHTDRSIEEFRLLGYFIGDGNTCHGKRPGDMASNITCNDPIQGEDIVHCANHLGFIARWNKGKNRTERYDLKNGVRPWLREVGLAGKNSHTKRVPEFVFTAPLEHISNFLGAYFACDGTLGHVRSERSTASVIFNSVNKPLLEDVQHLLLRFGVKSRLREHTSYNNNFTGTDHKSWRLVITSTDDTSKFIASIPVIGIKAQRLQSIGILRTRFDESIQPDRIKTIEGGGKCKCRCLTIDQDGSFTANDLIVKNTGVMSVFWPAWEWTANPWIRYWTASYEIRLSGRISSMSRDLMLSDWYQERWGHVFSFVREGENYFGNDKGGTRLATAPRSTGSGEHGHRIIIDDPINAKEVDALSRVTLDEVNSWYDGTVSSRGIGSDFAKVIIMQRLHENDLASHAMESDQWEILCLPERYEAKHPFVWPHDPRSRDGELLWPTYRTEDQSNALAKQLTSFRAAGQLQQRPAAREGDLLKQAWWRFYDPRIREKEEWGKLPRFSMICTSVDTPQKDKETNDNIAIQCWGIKGADRYLLDLRLAKMNYGSAKRTVKEMAKWSRRTWPQAPNYVLIENAAYGVEMITDLKREITGIQKITRGADGDKIMRAEAASDALESGNCFVPGYGPPWQPSYDEHRSPADVAQFIHSCGTFPNATHDDDVDAWSQAMNWLRGRNVTPMRTSSPHKLKH